MGNPVFVGSKTLIGHSEPFRKMMRTLQRLAPLREPVLLRGETGTGKELAAQFLHASGPRASGPLVAVNCAAIPDSLAESELFGHLRGAFTGAHRTHQGAFARADGGTLFLDEVAELSPLLQAKLLRALESGHVVPVGSDVELGVDCRIVAATHRDLELCVERGLLREDLYHRLGVLPVDIPPLRQRREDIPGLMRHFAGQAERQLGRTIIVTEPALRAAQAHSWPGNIRALRNAVFRAAALSDGPIDGRLLDSTHRRRAATRQTAAHDAIRVPRGDYASMRRALIEHVIAEEGSIRRAARALGIPRSTLGTWVRRGRDEDRADSAS